MDAKLQVDWRPNNIKAAYTHPHSKKNRFLKSSGEAFDIFAIWPGLDQTWNNKVTVWTYWLQKQYFKSRDNSCY